MELVVDDLHPGTDERTWLGASRLAALRPLHQRRPRRLVVVAPHPDDEVLGAGGLLQYMDRVGVETVVVAVTDGEASHPGARTLGCDLAEARSIETRVALDRLGCGSVGVQRLRFPDGAVAERGQHLTDVLGRPARPRRPLPQPVAVGWPPRSRSDRPRGASRRSLEPHTCPRIFGLDLALGNTGRCCRALEPMPSTRSGAAASRPQALGDLRFRLADQAPRLRLRRKTALDGLRAAAILATLRGIHRGEVMTSTSRSYFEEMYRNHADPWEFESSLYEQRKYAVTVASLPRSRYRSAYEPGCSVGVLTELLATRCDRLLSSDIIPSALLRAEARLRRRPHVWFQERSIPDQWPPGPFDLVVLSEIAVLLRRDRPRLCHGMCHGLDRAGSSCRGCPLAR